MPTAEVATWDLCRDALRTGKRLYVPRFSEDGGSFSEDMDMLRVRSEHELHTLIPNRWGIGEPPADADGAPRENGVYPPPPLTDEHLCPRRAALGST